MVDVHKVKSYEEKLVTFFVELDTVVLYLKAKSDGLIRSDTMKADLGLPHIQVLQKRVNIFKHVYETLEQALVNFEIQISSCSSVQEIVQKTSNNSSLVKYDNVSEFFTSSFQSCLIPSSVKLRYLLNLVHKNLQERLKLYEELTLRVTNSANMGDSVFEFQSTKVLESAVRAIKAGTSTEVSTQTPLDLIIEEWKAGHIGKEVLDHLISLFPEEPRILWYCYFKVNILAIREAHSYFSRDLLAIMPHQLSLHLDSSTNTAGIVTFPLDLDLPLKISDLNMLVAYSSKWRHIGSALEFQPQDLDNIQACPVLTTNDAPKSYLIRLLEEWISRKHAHVLLPTFSNLKIALDCQMVGLGRVAHILEEKLISKQHSTNYMNQSYLLIQASSNSKFESQKLCVGENTSALIEVQTEIDLVVSTYNWFKNGTKLKTSNGPFLCIQADLDLDGAEYSCKVELNSTECLKTPLVRLNVSSSLDHFEPYLKLKYNELPVVSDDTWFPVGNQKYINLVLINQHKAAKQCSAIHSDHKQKIECKEIQEFLKSGQLILIQGRPGSGKTTFVRKLTRDWSSKSGGSIRLMLQVSLRKLNALAEASLFDILKLFKGQKITPEVIEERAGKGVCFIFDGFDEFMPPDGENSIVYEIINKTYLPKSTVVVASRHAGVAKLRHRAHKVVEVLGFYDAQILEYFDDYFKDKSKSTELKAYLNFHPNIFYMCYLPIHAAMVAHIFEVNGEIPKTETMVYKYFTNLTIVRKKKRVKYVDVCSLSRPEFECFQKICKFAFEKTVSRKPVLHEDEVSCQLQDQADIDVSLGGLITIDRAVDLYDYKDIYTFQHLTFQEFLAAYHISMRTEEEQIELIKEHGDKTHMLTTWKFYFGLIEIQPFKTMFKLFLQQTKGNILLHIHCAYESQQPIVCAQFLKSNRYHIEIVEQQLSTLDFTAISYVANSSPVLSKLSFFNCNVDMYEIHKHTKVIKLALINSTIMPLPSCQWPVIQCLQVLEIVGCDKGRELGEVIGNIKYYTNLRVLNLSGNKIGRNIAEMLADNLKECQKLEQINISDNDIPCLGIFEILKSISQFDMHIKAAEITQQNRFRISNLELLSSLESFINLQSLDISLDSTDTERFYNKSKKWSALKKLKVLSQPLYVLLNQDKHFFKSFQHFPALQILSLKYSIDGIESTRGLMTALRQCPNLQMLDLSDNRIGPKEVESISAELFNHINLMELNLSRNRIGDDGVKILLMYCHNIQELGLNKNGISRSGCMALSANLHNCTKLQKLDLQFNDIESDAAYEVMSALNHCANFKLLV